jgi:hypothetical protein
VPAPKAQEPAPVVQQSPHLVQFESPPHVPQPALPVLPEAPVYYPPPPTYLVERNFASALDRSFSTIRRAFSSDFAAKLREASQTTFSIDFDGFTERLLTDLGQSIEAPVPGLDLHGTNLKLKVSSVIDEHTRPMTSALQEARSRNASALEHHISELKLLQRELDSLRSMLKSNTDSVLRELERERLNTSAFRESEHCRARDLETRLRTLKLTQVELDAKAAHQRLERDNLDRLAKQQTQKRQEWEDELALDEFGEGAGLRQRILEEIAAIRRDAQRDTYADVGRIVDDGLRMLKQEGDSMRGELGDLEAANRWAVARIQQTQVSVPVTPKKRVRSSLVTEAQMKVDSLRRMRTGDKS